MIDKNAIIRSSFKAAKSFVKRPEGIAAVGTGTAAVGAGFVDTRDDIKKRTKDLPKLPANWAAVKKHVQPGDILLGANRPPSLSNYFGEFKKEYSKARRSGLNRRKSVKAARKVVNPNTLLSKFGDPIYSHTGVVGTGGKLFYTGGGKPKHITKDDLGRDAAHAKQLKEKRGIKPYYVVIRPKKKDANLLQQTLKTKGSKAADELIKRIAGKPKDYSVSRAMWEQTKREVMPKLKTKKEFAKSKDVLNIEKKMTGGICSTTAGVLSKRTIAGQKGKSLLPEDVAHSPDFKMVAQIGEDRKKPDIITKSVLGAPKTVVKGGAGVMAGGMAYAATKAVKAMVKGPKVKNFASLVRKIR